MSVLTLKEILKPAQNNLFGVGSFSPRNLYLIKYIMEGAKNKNSPIIIQVSSNELRWVGLDVDIFSHKFYSLESKYHIPMTLHLDHTNNFNGIKKAIDAKFTSVMIDGSSLPLEENIKLTKEVVDYAHKKGVSVEAELGKIGSSDKIETDNDEEFYTDPKEAEYFVEKTCVDALAISIGTVHGVYKVKDPKIDFDRLKKIRNLIDIPIVLHGGSGLPHETINKAIHFEGGGVSKINIATDLELSFIKSLGISERLLNNEYEKRFLESDLLKACEEVQKVVEDKIENYLFSKDKARFYL